MATGAQLFHNIRGTIRALLAGNSSLAMAFGKKDASGNLILPSGHLLLTNGTGTGQINTLFTYSGTTTAGATTQLTLNNGSLTDLGGAPITLTKLKFVLIEVTTAGGTVYFGPQGVTNALQMSFSGTSSTDKQAVTKFQQYIDTTGWTVDSTHKVLAINNPGGTSVNWVMLGAGVQ